MKLLVCEDEIELSEVLVEILKRNNYQVDAVYDGEEALDYLDIEEYDGIILDIMMPKLNGIEVLKTIRANGNNTPVIMLTAKTELDDRVSGLDAGADDYLAKPFESKELLARVRAITRRKSELLSNNLEFNDLVLNRLTFELECNDNVVKLSSKEFLMMEMLMVSPKIYFSTEHIMEKIWGYESDSEINVVWVLVSAVRKKIKAVDSKVRLVASRKQGYRLEVDDA